MRSLLLVLTLGLLASVVDVSLAVAQGETETLTNQSIIDMVGAKLPEEIILAKIRSSATAFDVSTAGLVSLNNAGVSSAIVKEMLAARRHSESSSRAPRGLVEVATDEQELPEDPGIYMSVIENGAKRLIQLEPTVYTQGKTGGMLVSALTSGLTKTKLKAVVRGVAATINTSDPSPTFIFVFETTEGAGPGASPFIMGASSPNEFTLVQFDVKKRSREVTVSSASVLGSQSGTEDRAVVEFRFTKLRPGVYRVTPSVPLEAGQYCFLSATAFGASGAGTAGANKVFDFGISF